MTRDPLRAAAEIQLRKSLDKYENELAEQLISAAGAQEVQAEIRKARVSTNPNYRKLAFAYYEQFGQIVCAHCGFGIQAVLEVAHVDRNRSCNVPANWAILCPTCHRMYDLDLITTETIILMRDRPKIANWATLMKDAGKKAAATRKSRAAKATETQKWKAAGLKAAQTRKRNAETNKTATELRA